MVGVFGAAWCWEAAVWLFTRIGIECIQKHLGICTYVVRKQSTGFVRISVLGHMDFKGAFVCQTVAASATQRLESLDINTTFKDGLRNAYSLRFWSKSLERWWLS
jgi:hypothetical protein